MIFIAISYTGKLAPERRQSVTLPLHQQDDIMSRFRVIPLDPAFEPVETTSDDPHVILEIVERTRCGDADVERDGVYIFSLGKDAWNVWNFYQRTATAS